MVALGRYYRGYDPTSDLESRTRAQSRIQLVLIGAQSGKYNFTRSYRMAVGDDILDISFIGWLLVMMF